MGLDVRRFCASCIILLLSLAVVEGMHKRPTYGRKDFASNQKPALKGNKITKRGRTIANRPDAKREIIEECNKDFQRVYHTFEDKVRDALGANRKNVKTESEANEMITKLLQRHSPTYFYDLESTECETALKHSQLREDLYKAKSAKYCYGSKAIFTDKAVNELEKNEVPKMEKHLAMNRFLPSTQFASAVAFRGDKRSPGSVS